MTPPDPIHSEFPIQFEVQIDWSEVDAFGHINNLAIMRYVQSTRVHAMEHIGMMQHHATTGIGPILATTSCQFKKQLYYPGTVTIFAKIDHIKTTSFQMNHIVMNEAQEIVAEAHDVLVVFDFNKNSKCPIPPSFRDKLLSLGASDAR